MNRPKSQLFLSCVLIWVFSSVGFAAPKAEVSIGFYIVDGEHRRMVDAQMNRFRALHPDISLNLKMHRGEQYNQVVDKWLSDGRGPDVLFWHGGQQVEYYSRQGKLKNIKEFWEKNELDNVFSSAGRDAVEFGGKIYGIPVTEQLWGLFYRISTAQKYDIELPLTWESMLSACATAKKHDATLFAFAGQTTWTAHAWFDYLNMRVNGLEYHQKLLDGEVSFLDKGVLRTLEHWKEILDSDCINSHNFHELSKENVFSLLFHERAFIVLTFSRTRFPEAFDNDFSFSPFPSINPSIPQYTVAPVEVFIVPAYAETRPELTTVLKFLASAEFQEAVNSSNRITPAHRHAAVSEDALSKKQASVLRTSPGGIQYFDRNTRFDFASETPQIFIDFMDDRNVKRCANRLEALREKVFQ